MTTVTSPSIHDVFNSTFNQHASLVEAMTYDLMDQFVENYNGGYYENAIGPDGAFVRFIDDQTKHRVSGTENYFDGHMTLKDASIGCFLIAVNQLAWVAKDAKHNDLFYKCRDFALDFADDPSQLISFLD